MTLTFRDPSRLPVIEASGPVSATLTNEKIIVTFTQVVPKIDGIQPGMRKAEAEAIAVARLAFTPDNLRAFWDVVSGLDLGTRRPEGQA